MSAYDVYQREKQKLQKSQTKKKKKNTNLDNAISEYQSIKNEISTKGKQSFIDIIGENKKNESTKFPFNSSLMEKSSRLNNSELSPVKLSDEEYKNKLANSKEEKPWYQRIFTKGEFKDGYQFGDVSKTILGTATDISDELGKGLLSPIESVVDIGANLAASGANALGYKDAEKSIRDFANADITGNISKNIANSQPTGLLYNIVNGTPENIFNPSGYEWNSDKNLIENGIDLAKRGYLGLDADGNKIEEEKDYEKSSVLGEYAEKTTELVGYGLSLAFGGQALSSLGKGASVGTSTLGASANAGNIGINIAGKTLNIPTLALAGGMAGGLEEANSKEGVTELERWSKALSSGAIEGITEGLFGMLKVGGVTNEAGEEVFDVLASKLSSNLKSQLAKTLTAVGVKASGESIEEFLSYGANYLVDNGIIDKLGQADFSKEWDWGEVAEQMALAFVSAGITQGGGQVIQTNSAIKEAEDQLGRKLTNDEKALVTQASLEGALEQKVAELENRVNTQEQTTQAQPQTNLTLEEIDNQIAVLESQLNGSLSDEQYSEIENKIKELENLAEQIEQNGPTTTQEVETNSPVELPSNTLNTGNETITKSIEELQQELKKTKTPEERYNIVSQIKALEDGYNSVAEHNAAIETERQKSLALPVREVTQSPVVEENLPAMSGRQSTQVNAANAQSIPQVVDNQEVINNTNESVEEVSQEDILPETQEERKISKEWTEKVQEQDRVNRPLAIEQAKTTGRNTMVGYSPILSNNKLYSKGSLSWVAPDGKLNSKVVAETEIDEFLSKNKIDKLENGINTFENGLENKLPTKKELDNNSSLNEENTQVEMPTKTTTEKSESISPIKSETTSKVQEDLVPIKEATKELKRAQKEVKAQVKELQATMKEFKALTKEQYEDFNKQYNESLEQLNEMLPPVRNNLTQKESGELDSLESLPFDPTEEMQERIDNLKEKESNNFDLNEEFGDRPLPVKSPLEQRDIDEVGRNRKIKAYQYEHPEFRPFFQEAAQHMLYDLKDSTKGERILIGDTSQFGNANEQKWVGIKRQTTDDIAYLRDVYNYSTEELEKGLNAIIKDHGAENIAVSKRIEIMLDERLREGYTDVSGYEIPPNQEYISFLEENNWTDYYRSINSTNDIVPYTEHEIENYKNGRVILAQNEEVIDNFIETATKTPNNNKLYFGKIGELEADKLKRLLGIDLTNYNISLKNDAIRHTLKQHGGQEEALRGQVPVTLEDFKLIPEIISNYDDVRQSGLTEQGKPSITFEKQIGDTYYLVNYVSDKNHTLEVQTIFKHKKKNSATGDNTLKSPIQTSETDSSTSSSVQNISQNGNNVNLPVQEAPIKPIDYVLPTRAEQIETKTNLETGALEQRAPQNIEVPTGPIEYTAPTKTEQTNLVGDPEGKNLPSRKEVTLKYQTKAIKAFADKGFNIEEVFNKAKSKSTWASVDNTPERFTEKTLGYKEGKIFNELTTYQVAKNESEAIKWLNSFTNRKDGFIKKISKEYKIKPRSKESAAAQMYGEGFYVDEKGERIKYGDEQLAVDFPNAEVRENIKKLAKDPRIRNLYDDTLKRINESRTRNGYKEIPRLDNYFLHYRAMEDTFSQIGIPFNPNDIRAKDLPTDLNGVTADLKPGQPYFASAQHRTGFRTTYDLLGGLERYLGSAKNQIFHIDDIQMYRAMRNMIADTYGQAKGLENIDALTEEEQEARIKYVYDAHLSNFAKFLNEQANVIAGKTSLMDRGVEGIIGRRGIQFIDSLNRQVGANMIAFNVSPALTNLIAPVQATAKTNKFSVLKAFGQTAGNSVLKMFGKSDGFMENDPTAIRRRGVENYTRTPWQKVQDVGYAFMGGIDNLSTELIIRMKYNELVDKKGMSHEDAQREAGRFAMRILGDRSLGQMPQMFNSKMMNTVLKFQLEVRNQLDSQFYDTFREAELSTEQINNGLARNARRAGMIVSTLAQLTLFQHLFGKAFEEVAGYNPAFDIISVIMKTFGFDDDEESEDNFIDNIWDGVNEFLGDLPYVSTLTGGRIPIGEALPFEELLSGKDQYGNEKSRLETLGEALPYYILPGGYGQAKKTAQGLSMFDERLPLPGSYTDGGNLRFAVEPTIGNALKSAVFGQWSSEEARKYINSDFKTIDKDNVEELKDLGMTASEYRKYRKGLSAARKSAKDNDELSQTEAIFDYINGLDVTDEQKSIMFENQFNNHLDDEGEAKLNSLNMSTDEKVSFYTTKSAISEYETDYKNQVDKIKKQYGENSTEYEERVESLSKEKQKKVISKVLEANLTDEQKKYIYTKYYSSEESLDNITSRGTSVDTYLQYKLDTLDYTSDEDEEGDTINGSLAKKKINYLLSSDLSTNDIQTLYENDILSGFDDEKKYKSYKAVKAMGVDIQSWLNYSTQEFEADYNYKGNVIRNSKRNKVINYVNTLDLDIPQKAAIIRTQYSSFDDYNNTIVSYVDNLNIDYSEKIEILESLEMTVYEDGTVRWD